MCLCIVQSWELHGCDFYTPMSWAALIGCDRDRYTSLTEFRILGQELSPCSASCLSSVRGREDNICSSRLSISFLICAIAARRLAFCSCSFFISKVGISLLRELLSSQWNICKMKVQHNNNPLLMSNTYSLHNTTHRDPSTFNPWTDLGEKNHRKKRDLVILGIYQVKIVLWR